MPITFSVSNNPFELDAIFQFDTNSPYPAVPRVMFVQP